MRAFFRVRVFSLFLLFLLEVSMKRRHKLSKRFSRSMFTRTADGAHRKNFQGNPMRGGIRL